jgi:transcriptional regulator with XRE-family HTH domain
MAMTAAEALGRAIEQRRKLRGWTQPELAEHARAYGFPEAGAVVAISRIEKGRVRPNKDKVAALAAALAVSMPVLTDLAARIQLAANAGDDSPEDADRRGAVRAVERLFIGATAQDNKRRVTAVNDAVQQRSASVEEALGRLNREVARADTEFLEPLIEALTRLAVPDLLTRQGEPLDPTVLRRAARVDLDPSDFASARVTEVISGLSDFAGRGLAGVAGGGAAGAGAAWAAFSATAAWGTASTGVAISGLYGVAATNATLAALGGGALAAGGAGIAGGVAVLTGIVAAPALLLAGVAVVIAGRRSRSQALSTAERLDEADEQLRATQPAFTFLIETLHRSAAITEQTTTIASRALSVWGRRTQDNQSWHELAEVDQERYADLIKVAARLTAMLTIPVAGLLTITPDELPELVERINAVLDLADSAGDILL